MFSRHLHLGWKSRPPPSQGIRQPLLEYYFFVFSTAYTHPLKDLELVVEDEEREVGRGGVAAVQERDVAALPVHLLEVHQGRVQTDAGA